MKQLLRVVVALCFLGAVAAPPAGATDCAPNTVAEGVAKAETIVIGTVTAVDESVLSRSGNTVTMPEQGIPHQLDIERIYKGDAGSSLTVYQRWVLGAPNLQVGDRWLLFLYRDAFGNLSAGPCTPSAQLPPGGRPSPELAAALGAGRAVNGAVWDRWGPALVILIASAGVGLLMWRLGRRGRGR